MFCATKPSRRTAVEDAKSWRHGRRSRDWQRNGRRQRLGPRCERGGDGRRAASRPVRRPRRERRLGRRRGGGNLSAREVLAIFAKPATYPGFADPPKPQTGSSSTWRHRSKDFESKKETPSSIEIVYRDSAAPTGLTGPQDRFDRSGRSWRLNTPTSPWLSEFLESLESFSVFPSPSPCSRLGSRSPTQRKVRL